MAVNRRKQDDKNLEILRELISLNGNKYCLDCNQRGPTYVNTTIGSFVCSKCSGMLRGLTPPHRVKSISMATFTSEEIEFIRSRGNDYCRRVWLGLYEGESVNFSDEQSVKDFMSSKYEKKLYYLESNGIVTNGNLSSKSKSKVLNENTVVATSIPRNSSQSYKGNSNNYIGNPVTGTSDLFAPDVFNKMNVISVNHNVLTNSNGVSNSLPGFPPVNDFPVDFSTAEIYNANQLNSSINNNNYSTKPTTLQTFNVLNSTTSVSNDRYAALADLDLALRQQNLKNMEDTNNVKSKNPFQNSLNNANKNPFANGGWSVTSFESASINPFMPSGHNGSFINSNNPFL